MVEINKYEDMVDFVRRNRPDNFLIDELIKMHNKSIKFGELYLIDDKERTRNISINMQLFTILIGLIDMWNPYIETYIPREEW